MDRDDTVIHQNAASLTNMTVRLAIDGQEAVLYADVSITARHKSKIIWAKGLARWNGGPVTICDDNAVFSNSSFHSSEKQIV